MEDKLIILRGPFKRIVKDVGSRHKAEHLHGKFVDDTKTYETNWKGPEQ